MLDAVSVLWEKGGELVFMQLCIQFSRLSPLCPFPELQPETVGTIGTDRSAEPVVWGGFFPTLYLRLLFSDLLPAFQLRARNFPFPQNSKTPFPRHAIPISPSHWLLLFLVLVPVRVPMPCSPPASTDSTELPQKKSCIYGNFTWISPAHYKCNTKTGFILVVAKNKIPVRPMTKLHLHPVELTELLPPHNKSAIIQSSISFPPFPFPRFVLSSTSILSQGDAHT
ncbi:hypothetical protein V8F06_003353 [Rhypophila decipiens]